MGKYFGTDGFRGVANEQLTAKIAYRIGRFIGQFGNKKNNILIARDTRISGHFIADAVCCGIVSSGGTANNLRVATTSSVSYLVRKFGFDYGIMISASHNPYYDNGIKLFNNEGEKLENSIELQIEDYIDSDNDYLPFPINENIGSYPRTDRYLDDYIDFLVSKASPLISGQRILIDCANGSASVVAKNLINKLGINADIINANPNGININDRCGSTHLSDLAKKIKAGKYDIAFAFDGDADRCLAVAPNGRIIDGDAIMFLNAVYLKKNDMLDKNTVVLTVMSNLGLKKALKKHNIEVSEVGVGDKYVQAEMKQNGYSLGGEQSGHIIFLEDMNTGDGLLTMIKILNVLASEKKPVLELISDFKVYPQCLKNITVTNKDAILTHAGFIDYIKEVEASLNGNGRILVRASGTEPLIRVMCEALTSEICNEVCDKLIQYIEEIQ